MMRRGLVWAALVCTLLACWWVEQADEQASSPAATAEPAPRQRVRLAQALPLPHPSELTAPAASAPVLQGVLDTAHSLTTADDAAIDLFAVLHPASAESAQPVAPEAVNPYTYAGRLQEDGRWTVFLTDGQQQYVLHAGDSFADGWQVALLDQQKIVLQHAAERFEIRLDNGVVF